VRILLHAKCTLSKTSCSRAGGNTSWRFSGLAAHQSPPAISVDSPPRKKEKNFSEPLRQQYFLARQSQNFLSIDRRSQLGQLQKHFRLMNFLPLTTGSTITTLNTSATIQNIVIPNQSLGLYQFCRLLHGLQPLLAVHRRLSHHILHCHLPHQTSRQLRAATDTENTTLMVSVFVAYYILYTTDVRIFC
jgi:hypothetical protein